MAQRKVRKLLIHWSAKALKRYEDNATFDDLHRAK